MAGSSQIRFSDDIIGDPNDLDDLIEGTGRDLSDVSGDEEDGQRRSGAEEDGEEQGEGEQQGSDNDGENQKKDDKSDDPTKKKRKLAPRHTLNPARLKGPRGLTALSKEFENFKFRGKGHELEDLERVLVRMEHWAHRLMPKMHFEDFIVKAEKLCTKKKEMQVYMKRIRMGLETGDDEIIREEDEEAVDDPKSVQNKALTEFDKLLDEQISYYEANPTEPVRTPKTPAALPPSSTIVPNTAFTLSAEQKELIARKKREAMERRQARLQEMEEEQLAEATAASLASAEKPDSDEPSSTTSIPPPSDDADKAAEQRERAARNRELALERLRARRLAALGSSQPPQDLNASSSSDPAAPPSESPKTASPPEESAKPENPCHVTLSDQTNETSSPENMDQTDGENQSREELSSPGNRPETEDVSPDNQPEESVSDEGRDQSRKDLSSSGKMSETEDVSSVIQSEESVSDEGKDQSRKDLSSSGKISETTDVFSEGSVLTEDKSLKDLENVAREESAPVPNEVSSGPRPLSPEKMETDVMSPKKSIPDAAEKMDETD